MTDDNEVEQLRKRVAELEAQQGTTRVIGDEEEDDNAAQLAGAVATFNDIVQAMRDASEELGRVAAHHPTAATLKKYIDQALRFVPAFSPAEAKKLQDR